MGCFGGSADSDNIAVQGSAGVRLAGGVGSDKLSGGSGSDNLFGKAGNDAKLTASDFLVL